MNRRALASFLAFVLATAVAAARPGSRPLERVRVADDGASFVLTPSGLPFVPWGLNYDHDRAGRLLEDYWEGSWGDVVADFAEMRLLGANVVRVHLQLGKFMRSADEPDQAALARLGALLALAERVGLRLDLTGLGCYRRADVPSWYERLDEAARWDVQARFWSAVAARCAGSPALFCYDLMNEPVAPAGPPRSDWLGPSFGGYHYVQRIGLDLAGRDRTDVARAWIRRLVAAIRPNDPRGLVTVGLVPWSLARPGLTSGFAPEAVAPLLDFLSVHLYPERGALEAGLETLRGFSTGKPVVVEECFPLRCSPDELRAFMERGEPWAAGWMGFYWGATRRELRAAGDLRSALMLGWLDLFRRGPP